MRYQTSVVGVSRNRHVQLSTHSKVIEHYAFRRPADKILTYDGLPSLLKGTTELEVHPTAGKYFSAACR